MCSKGTSLIAWLATSSCTPCWMYGHPGSLTREVLCSRPHKPSYQRCFLGSKLWPRTQLSSSALLPAPLLLEESLQGLRAQGLLGEKVEGGWAEPGPSGAVVIPKSSFQQPPPADSGFTSFALNFLGLSHPPDLA